EVPNDVRCEPYGTQHFHHPELLDMMSVLAPETKLLDLIDQKLFANAETVAHEACELRSAQLEIELTGPTSLVNYEARKLLIFNSACGQYLGRLAQRQPHRISKRIYEGHTIWKIHPPSDTEIGNN